MNYLERIVDRTVNWYRVAFLIISAVVGWNMVGQDFKTIALWFGVIWLCYVLGFFVLIFLIRTFADQERIRSDFQQERIADINEKLRTGELKPGRELDEIMIEAGLEPLPDIKERGPVFGKFADADLHEWIDASIGVDGPVLRYQYVGQARYDRDGTPWVPNPGLARYLTVDDILYEAKLDQLAQA